jgi:hypothetical protein
VRFQPARTCAGAWAGCSSVARRSLSVAAGCRCTDLSHPQSPAGHETHSMTCLLRPSNLKASRFPQTPSCPQKDFTKSGLSTGSSPEGAVLDILFSWPVSWRSINVMRPELVTSHNVLYCSAQIPPHSPPNPKQTPTCNPKNPTPKNGHAPAAATPQ